MHVGIVGAGAVGLSTAWYLRERGADVTVFEKEDVGAGASWGNAGHIVPAMSVPLAEPANLRYALTSFWKRNAPVTAPRTVDRDLLRFLLEFGRNSTRRRYLDSVRQMMVLSRSAIAEFEHLERTGVRTTRKPAPFTSALTGAGAARYLLDEYATVTEAGYPAEISLLSGAELRKREPLVGSRFHFGVELGRQSLLEPPRFLSNLVESLQSAVQIERGCEITGVERSHGRLRVTKRGSTPETFDAVVVATGAWLTRLAADHGVAAPIVAGRGYSMSVAIPHATRGMLYFPESRIATTAYGDRLRVSSLMQIGKVEDPGREAGRQRLLRTAKAVLPQLDWNTADEFWSGGRPLSVDGRPLVGRTTTDGVYINGGHGMWGVTLGPVSGKHLANEITGSAGSGTLDDFDPLRFQK